MSPGSCLTCCDPFLRAQLLLFIFRVAMPKKQLKRMTLSKIPLHNRNALSTASILVRIPM